MFSLLIKLSLLIELSCYSAHKKLNYMYIIDNCTLILYLNYREVAILYKQLYPEIVHQRKLLETLNSICGKMKNFMIKVLC